MTDTYFGMGGGYTREDKGAINIDNSRYEGIRYILYIAVHRTTRVATFAMHIGS